MGHPPGVTLESLTQRQLEDYLAEHPGGRNSQQNFVAWLRRSRINSTVNIPWRESTIPEVVVSDADRWDQINLLLHDEQISLYARIGGLFTLLFAQPLEKIVAMRTNQINVEDDGRVLVAFDTIPIEMGSWRKPLRLNSRPDGCCPGLSLPWCGDG